MDRHRLSTAGRDAPGTVAPTPYAGNRGPEATKRPAPAAAGAAAGSAPAPLRAPTAVRNPDALATVVPLVRADTGGK